MKNPALCIFALACSLALPPLSGAGCTMAVEEGQPYADEIGATSLALWTVETPVETREWDSGNTNNLSGWEAVTCAASHGNNYLVGQLQGWRERDISFDDSVARMTVDCAEYEHDDPADVFLQNGNRVTEVLFTGAYDNGRTGASNLISSLIPIMSPTCGRTSAS